MSEKYNKAFIAYVNLPLLEEEEEYNLFIKWGKGETQVWNLVTILAPMLSPV